ncbi:ser thr protein phosphatase superfamily protein [Stemphylium lycopersici]|nr:ser thr protein phosphatase superfamily protein [Stemphylium lycopersici]RAQ99189.1 ser thr protein phosphatase superfamily protein [Stemphylium lycopersici]
MLPSKMRRLSDLFSGPKASFQILSDLHLDHESQYLTFHIPVAAPFLILAGNIGRLIDYEQYLSFLIRRCNLHEKVFLVLGALEFHGIGWMDGLQLAHKLEKEPATRGKLEVLYETRSEVPGTNITLLGCTLWSKIPESDAATVLRKMPEFDAESGIQEWDVEKHNLEHKRDFKWLVDEVKKPSAAASEGGLAPTGTGGKEQRQVVVVTAFTPDLRGCLEPWQIDAPWASAYGTNLLNGPYFNNVKILFNNLSGLKNANRHASSIWSSQLHFDLHPVPTRRGWKSSDSTPTHMIIFLALISTMTLHFRRHPFTAACKRTLTTLIASKFLTYTLCFISYFLSPNPPHHHQLSTKMSCHQPPLPPRPPGLVFRIVRTLSHPTASSPSGVYLCLPRNASPPSSPTIDSELSSRTASTHAAFSMLAGNTRLRQQLPLLKYDRQSDVVYEAMRHNETSALSDAQLETLRQLFVVKTSAYTEALRAEVEAVEKIHRLCGEAASLHMGAYVVRSQHTFSAATSYMVQRPIFGPTLAEFGARSNGQGVLAWFVGHICVGLIDALEFLHENAGTVHGRIAAENVMLNLYPVYMHHRYRGYPDVQLIDFSGCGEVAERDRRVDVRGVLKVMDELITRWSDVAPFLNGITNVAGWGGEGEDGLVVLLATVRSMLADDFQGDMDMETLRNTVGALAQDIRHNGPSTVPWDLMKLVHADLATDAELERAKRNAVVIKFRTQKEEVKAVVEDAPVVMGGVGNAGMKTQRIMVMRFRSKKTDFLRAIGEEDAEGETDVEMADEGMAGNVDELDAEEAGRSAGGFVGSKSALEAEDGQDGGFEEGEDHEDGEDLERVSRHVHSYWSGQSSGGACLPGAEHDVPKPFMGNCFAGAMATSHAFFILSVSISSAVGGTLWFLDAADRSFLVSEAV